MVDSLTVPDIRNSLSPICHLICLLEADEIGNSLTLEEYEKLKSDAILQAKKEINYLAQRDVYKLT